MSYFWSALAKIKVESEAPPREIEVLCSRAIVCDNHIDEETAAYLRDITTASGLLIGEEEGSENKNVTEPLDDNNPSVCFPTLDSETQQNEDGGASCSGSDDLAETRSADKTDNTLGERKTDFLANGKTKDNVSLKAANNDRDPLDCDNQSISSFDSKEYDFIDAHELSNSPESVMEITDDQVICTPNSVPNITSPECEPNSLQNQKITDQLESFAPITSTSASGPGVASESDSDTQNDLIKQDSIIESDVNLTVQPEVSGPPNVTHHSNDSDASDVSKAATTATLLVDNCITEAIERVEQNIENEVSDCRSRREPKDPEHLREESRGGGVKENIIDLETLLVPCAPIMNRNISVDINDSIKNDNYGDLTSKGDLLGNFTEVQNAINTKDDHEVTEDYHSTNQNDDSTGKDDIASMHEDDDTASDEDDWTDQSDYSTDEDDGASTDDDSTSENDSDPARKNSAEMPDEPASSDSSTVKIGQSNENQNETRDSINDGALAGTAETVTLLNETLQQLSVYGNAFTQLSEKLNIRDLTNQTNPFDEDSEDSSSPSDSESFTDFVSASPGAEQTQFNKQVGAPGKAFTQLSEKLNRNHLTNQTNPFDEDSGDSSGSDDSELFIDFVSASPGAKHTQFNKEVGGPVKGFTQFSEKLNVNQLTNQTNPFDEDSEDSSGSSDSEIFTAFHSASSGTGQTQFNKEVGAPVSGYGKPSFLQADQGVDERKSRLFSKPGNPYHADFLQKMPQLPVTKPVIFDPKHGTPGGVHERPQLDTNTQIPLTSQQTDRRNTVPYNQSESYSTRLSRRLASGIPLETSPIVQLQRQHVDFQQKYQSYLSGLRGEPVRVSNEQVPLQTATSTYRVPFDQKYDYPSGSTWRPGSPLQPQPAQSRRALLEQQYDYYLSSLHRRLGVAVPPLPTPSQRVLSEQKYEYHPSSLNRQPGVPVQPLPAPSEKVLFEQNYEYHPSSLNRQAGVPVQPLSAPSQRVLYEPEYEYHPSSLNRQPGVPVQPLSAPSQRVLFEQEYEYHPSSLNRQPGVPVQPLSAPSQRVLFEQTYEYHPSSLNRQPGVPVQPLSAPSQRVPSEQKYEYLNLSDGSNGRPVTVKVPLQSPPAPSQVPFDQKYDYYPSSLNGRPAVPLQLQPAPSQRVPSVSRYEYYPSSLNGRPAVPLQLQPAPSQRVPSESRYEYYPSSLNGGPAVPLQLQPAPSQRVPSESRYEYYPSSLNGRPATCSNLGVTLQPPPASTGQSVPFDQQYKSYTSSGLKVSYGQLPLHTTPAPLLQQSQSSQSVCLEQNCPYGSAVTTSNVGVPLRAESVPVTKQLPSQSVPFNQNVKVTAKSALAAYGITIPSTGPQTGVVDTSLMITRKCSEELGISYLGLLLLDDFGVLRPKIQSVIGTNVLVMLDHIYMMFLDCFKKEHLTELLSEDDLKNGLRIALQTIYGFGVTEHNVDKFGVADYIMPIAACVKMTVNNWIREFFGLPLEVSNSSSIQIEESKETRERLEFAMNLAMRKLNSFLRTRPRSREDKTNYDSPRKHWLALQGEFWWDLQRNYIHSAIEIVIFAALTKCHLPVYPNLHKDSNADNEEGERDETDDKELNQNYCNNEEEKDYAEFDKADNQKMEQEGCDQKLDEKSQDDNGKKHGASDESHNESSSITEEGEEEMESEEGAGCATNYNGSANFYIDHEEINCDYDYDLGDECIAEVETLYGEHNTCGTESACVDEGVQQYTFVNPDAELMAAMNLPLEFGSSRRKCPKRSDKQEYLGPTRRIRDSDRKLKKLFKQININYTPNDDVRLMGDIVSVSDRMELLSERMSFKNLNYEREYQESEESVDSTPEVAYARLSHPEEEEEDPTQITDRSDDFIKVPTEGLSVENSDEPIDIVPQYLNMHIYYDDDGNPINIKVQVNSDQVQLSEGEVLKYRDTFCSDPTEKTDPSQAENDMGGTCEDKKSGNDSKGESTVQTCREEFVSNHEVCSDENSESEDTIKSAKDDFIKPDENPNKDKDEKERSQNIADVCAVETCRKGEIKPDEISENKDKDEKEASQDMVGGCAVETFKEGVIKPDQNSENKDKDEKQTSQNIVKEWAVETYKEGEIKPDDESGNKDKDKKQGSPNVVEECVVETNKEGKNETEKGSQSFEKSDSDIDLSFEVIDGNNLDCSYMSVSAENNGLASTSTFIPFDDIVTKNKRAKRKRKMDVEIRRNPKLKKYWHKRFSLFRRFDEGIKLDEESWYSVTPELIANYTARRLSCSLIVDCFCGAGGNTIQFAQTCERVIAIDIDPHKIELAKHNARIYGVEDRIEFLVGDFFTLAESLRADCVFLSPPWGGPSYLAAKEYDLQTMLQPAPIDVLMEAAKKVSENMAIYLPRNSNVRPLLTLAGDKSYVEIEQNYLNDKFVAMTVFIYPEVK